MVEPLARGQKAFNQRIMAEHCLSEKRAQAIWDELSAANDMGASSFAKSIALSNAQLDYCGLEIVAVSVPNKEEGGSTQRHYAMINKHPDEIAKKCFQNKFTPKEHAFVRVVLEKIIEGPTPRSTLINLRSEVEDGNSFRLEAAEDTLQKMLVEKWLQEEGGARRGSMQAKIALAPRSYLELSYLLVDEFGMDKDELPQTIYHQV
jgi:Nse1 non-SMC component of SMC5-6 complex